jgi:hypothetical protein
LLPPSIPGLPLLSSLFTRLPLLRTLGCAKLDPPHLLNELGLRALNSSSFCSRTAASVAPAARAFGFLLHSRSFRGTCAGTDLSCEHSATRSWLTNSDPRTAPLAYSCWTEFAPALFAGEPATCTCTEVAASRAGSQSAAQPAVEAQRHAHAATSSTISASVCAAAGRQTSCAPFARRRRLLRAPSSSQLPEPASRRGAERS